MILSTLLILCFNLFAQVNLDQPIPLGPSDRVYKSNIDSNISYLIPSSLLVVGEPRIFEIDGQLRAEFKVDIDQESFNAISAKLSAPMSLRILRGWNALIDQKGSMDTPEKFKSKLIPLSDAGAFGESITYVFTAKKIGPKLGKETKSLFKNLFEAQSARHLGTILYEFNAQMGGAPYMARTAVGVFAANDKSGLEHSSKSVPEGIIKKAKLNKTSLILNYDAKPTAINFDNINKCWENLKLGEICLK